MNNNATNYVNKDELVGAAVALDAAQYIIQDLQGDFFDCYDSSLDDDKWCILHEYNRNRAKMAVLSRLIYEISQAFEQNKIDCYLSA